MCDVAAEWSGDVAVVEVVTGVPAEGVKMCVVMAVRRWLVCGGVVHGMV